MNSSRRFAPKLVLACCAAVLAGCTPENPSELASQALSAYAAKDVVRAGKLVQKCLKIDPQNVDAALLEVRLLMDLPEIARAREAYARVAALSNDIDVRLVGAQLAFQAKDYTEAAKLFAALANDSSLEAGVRAQAYAGQGVVEMCCNNYHAARLAFLRALRLDRRNAAAWYHLGCVYRDGFGYLEAARDQFETYVTLEVTASPRVQRTLNTTIKELKNQIAVNARNSGETMTYAAAMAEATRCLKTANKANQEKALGFYRRACVLKPSAISTYVTAGSLAYKLAHYAEAVEIYSRAVAANPQSLDALDGLIRALQKSGQASVAKDYQAYRDLLPKPKRR